MGFQDAQRLGNVLVAAEAADECQVAESLLGQGGRESACGGRVVRAVDQEASDPLEAPGPNDAGEAGGEGRGRRYGVQGTGDGGRGTRAAGVIGRCFLHQKFPKKFFSKYG